MGGCEIPPSTSSHSSLQASRPSQATGQRTALYNLQTGSIDNAKCSTDLRSDQEGRFAVCSNNSNLESSAPPHGPCSCEYQLFKMGDGSDCSICNLVRVIFRMHASNEASAKLFPHATAMQLRASFLGSENVGPGDTQSVLAELGKTSIPVHPVLEKVPEDASKARKILVTTRRIYTSCSGEERACVRLYICIEIYTYTKQVQLRPLSVTDSAIAPCP